MFWLIVLLMFLGAAIFPNPLAGWLIFGVIGCLFYKLCDFITGCNAAAHSALDRQEQRLYEEEQIRQATLKQLNAQKTKPD